jgi:tetratricopeptide (TPR) repeat protein
MSKRQYSVAAELFTKAIDLLSLEDRKSYGYILYYLRANAYMQMEEYELALEDSETSICLNDKFAKAYCEKGDALSALRRYESSVEAYNSAELIF